jgi:hypothetical protein
MNSKSKASLKEIKIVASYLKIFFQESTTSGCPLQKNGFWRERMAHMHPQDQMLTGAYSEEHFQDSTS